VFGRNDAPLQQRHLTDARACAPGIVSTNGHCYRREQNTLRPRGKPLLPSSTIHDHGRATRALSALQARCVAGRPLEGPHCCRRQNIDCCDGSKSIPREHDVCSKAKLHAQQRTTTGATDHIVSSGSAASKNLMLQKTPNPRYYS
jgi:hypothetical protein